MLGSARGMEKPGNGFTLLANNLVAAILSDFLNGFHYSTDIQH